MAHLYCFIFGDSYSSPQIRKLNDRLERLTISKHWACHWVCCEDGDEKKKRGPVLSSAPPSYFFVAGSSRPVFFAPFLFLVFFSRARARDHRYSLTVCLFVKR